MEQVKIFHDRTGNTLTVWFGNPQEEYVCEETGEEVILMKDRTGRVIGFEKLNFAESTPDNCGSPLKPSACEASAIPNVRRLKEDRKNHGKSA
jgi:hypothetical protein